MNKDLKDLAIASLITIPVFLILLMACLYQSIANAIFWSVVTMAILILLIAIIGKSWMAWQRIRWIWYRLKTYFNILF